MPELVSENSVQLGAFDSKNRGHSTIVGRRIEHIDEMIAVLIEIDVATVLNKIARRQDVIEHADIAQAAKTVAVDEYAGTLKPPYVLFFNEPNGEATRGKSDGNAAAGNSGAHNKNFIDLTQQGSLE